jgi:hypothetical protein
MQSLRDWRSRCHSGIPLEHWWLANVLRLLAFFAANIGVRLIDAAPMELDGFLGMVFYKYGAPPGLESELAGIGAGPP